MGDGRDRRESEELSLPGFNNQTIRMTMHASVGGDSARIRLSNAYGTKTLTVGDVTVGIPTKSGSGAVRPGTLHEVLFGGRATATIPRGATLMSDAIPINVAPNSDLVISIWLPTDTGPATWHVIGRSTTWIGKGDHSEDISAAGLPTKDTSWYFVTGIDVRNTTSNGSVVVFGDSISDGFTATVDADHRWPDRLAARLDALAASKHAPGSSTSVRRAPRSGMTAPRSGFRNSAAARPGGSTRMCSRRPAYGR